MSQVKIHPKTNLHNNFDKSFMSSFFSDRRGSQNRLSKRRNTSTIVTVAQDLEPSGTSGNLNPNAFRTLNDGSQNTTRSHK